jgi:HEAT repeat protein
MLHHLSLLLAVTAVVQDSTTARRRAVRARSGVTAIAPLSPALQDAAAALTVAEAQLQGLAYQAPMLAVSAQGLQAAVAALDATPILVDLGNLDLDHLDLDFLDQPQEPSDSLYRAGRSALNNSQYQRAVDLFRQFRSRSPRSQNIGNSYYWEAFALYRLGSDDELRSARTALRTLADKYPDATTSRDGEVLMRRVQGVLAQRGDAEAAASIEEDVNAIAPRAARPPSTPRPPRAPRPPKAPRPGRADSCDDDDDIRIAALNAVLQMDAERAVPLLKTVLARRDDGSACLRRKAVFLVSQKRSPETARILLDAVRSDPDREVREQAVFWLSQVPGEETVIALDSVLRASDDPAVQEKAIFAISQHRSARGAAILRDYAERQNAPLNLREQAIFWLGQRRSTENAEFLRGLYVKLENDELKDKVIFSVSQMGGTENYRWMMDIALNQNENIERRKQALFWAGQSRNLDVADLVRLYDSMKDRDMREQLIFVYSQRREDAALDKLFDIGKNDPDRELRKKAIFWIGQSRSPRAAQYLQELINQ